MIDRKVNQKDRRIHLAILTIFLSQLCYYSLRIVTIFCGLKYEVRSGIWAEQTIQKNLLGENRNKTSIMSLKKCISMESGRKSTKKSGLLDVNVSLRSSKTESFELDWLPVDTAKYLGLILMTVSLQNYVLF
jgi:hypothetical protein